MKSRSKAGTKSNEKASRREKNGPNGASTSGESQKDSTAASTDDTTSKEGASSSGESQKDSTAASAFKDLLLWINFALDDGESEVRDVAEAFKGGDLFNKLLLGMEVFDEDADLDGKAPLDVLSEGLDHCRIDHDDSMMQRVKAGDEGTIVSLLEQLHKFSKSPQQSLATRGSYIENLSVPYGRLSVASPLVNNPIHINGQASTGKLPPTEKGVKFANQEDKKRDQDFETASAGTSKSADSVTGSPLHRLCVHCSRGELMHGSANEDADPRGVVNTAWLSSILEEITHEIKSGDGGPDTKYYSINDADPEDDRGRSALHCAAESGKYNIIIALLGVKGIKLDVYNASGWTPFFCAIDGGHFDCVKLLYECGADINKATFAGYTSLMSACEDGYVEIVKYLISGHKDNESFKSKLASMKSEAKVKEEDAATKSEESNSPVTTAAPEGCEPRRVAMRGGVEKSPMGRPLLKSLPKADLDPMNAQMQTSLMLCAIAGRHECMKLLLEKGSNFKLRDEDNYDALYLCKTCDDYESSPDHQKCWKYLIAVGAKDNGEPYFPIDPYFKVVQEQKVDKDLDDLKIQTMFKMVDECRVISNGKDVVKKVLYLTNTQAVKFDEENMHRAIQALDIGEPKFVIKIVDSIGVASQMKLSHAESANDPNSVYGVSSFTSSEINLSDDRVVEQEIILFMKNCVLPLAMQTKALILVSGSNDCYLTAALARVALQEQARWGKNCPFTVLATASEKEVHARAVSNKREDRMSVAQQICRQSPTWSKSAWRMNEFYSDTQLRVPVTTKLPQCDLTDAAERFIVFESYDAPLESKSDDDQGQVNEFKDEDDESTDEVNESKPPVEKKKIIGSYNDGPRKTFESTLLQFLTRSLPSIAITALEAAHGVSFVMDLTSRGIPVLLLDTTERAFTLEKTQANHEIKTQLARWERKPKKPSDFSGPHAFPLISKEDAKTILKGKENEDEEKVKKVKSLLLDLAIEMMDNKMIALIQNSVVDTLTMSRLAFFHTVLHIGQNFSNTSSSTANIPLYKRIREMEKLAANNRDAKVAAVDPELLDKVMSYLFSKVPAFNLLGELANMGWWLNNTPTEHKHLVNGAIGRKKNLEASVEKMKRDSYGASYDRLMTDMDDNGNIIPKPDEWIENHDKLRYVEYKLDPDDWIAQHDLLLSSQVYSASVYDHDEATRILNTIAKIDRLPTANTLEALRVIQDGWDHVEVYMELADIYKRITKLCYVALLFLAMAITFLTLLNLTIGLTTRTAIVGIGFCASVLTSYVAYVNPAIKWQSLRMAAMAIKSNIWCFRTRAGPYRSNTTNVGNFDHSADELLSASIKDIKDDVLMGADIKSTTFYSRVKSKNVHQQHPPDGSFGALDNFSRKPGEDVQRTWWVYIEGKLSHLLPRTFTDRLEQASLGTSRKSVIDLEHGHDLDADNDDEKDFIPSTSKDDSKRVVSRRMSMFANDFLAKYKSTNKTNNDKIPLTVVLSQLRPDESDGMDLASAKDMHYEPIQPDLFVLFRILPAISFYKARIPLLARTKGVAQMLMVFGSIMVVLLSMLDTAAWASAVTIITSSISAWLEFSGTNAKIERYSTAVHSLQELVHWWQTLPQIDRSVVSNIDRLVLSCEELLQREQQGWKSTSQTVKMLQQQSEAASSSGGQNDNSINKAKSE